MSDLILEISKQSGLELKSPNEYFDLGSQETLKVRVENETTNFFVKTTKKHNHPRFSSEEEGLKLIAKTNTLRTPKVIACGQTKEVSFIILEYLKMTEKTSISAKKLGEKLAKMHKNTANLFGLDKDNWIGLTRQHNKQNNNWSTFYVEQRLLPQLELAYRNGYKQNLEKKANHLIGKIEWFFKDYSPEASLLHGDLWSGNWGAINNKPVIFDPAVYYGDRESDIAMTYLFGAFPQDFYSSYNKTWPLANGFEKRKNLYNLYHVLNHLNIFGFSYLQQCENLLDNLIQKL